MQIYLTNLTQNSYNSVNYLKGIEQMEKYKHLRVKESTHKKVKAIAALNGTGIDEAILMMIEAYKNKGTQNANSDYRKR